MPESAYFQKGFGLKSTIEGSLRRDYHSVFVEMVRRQGFRLRTPEVDIRLAEEFGFCYGVDRAVEYAYETVEKFPDRPITLIGEIIHNPHVNRRLREMKVTIITPEEAVAIAAGRFGPQDVVIIPAFGVPAPLFETLRATGCVLVDTTCGSVLNVWKNVDRYAAEGFTSVIHGKYAHEETRATASRAASLNAPYIIVRDLAQAGLVCDHIRYGGDRSTFLARFDKALSHGFDPDTDLCRLGLANQTTMLSSESLEIAGLLRKAMEDRWGEEAEARFRSFDTICSATQDRQDAVIQLAREPLDLMLVIGGYNSSNTNHLAAIASRYTRAYHIESPRSLVDASTIRHKPIGSHDETTAAGWLPAGHCVVAVTAGASTPNNKIGQVIERVLELRGVEPSAIGLDAFPPEG
ncbi:MAG TPA: 4-hydroxy-3-methylbut-2-enyl diphosphate reductase [Candidatus Saccharimonadales bacterium]|nr:4-hydroxy-3-methylbut-2-enyl diphosphate reductase [Candidatus Saccharimonadales bacterium]